MTTTTLLEPGARDALPGDAESRPSGPGEIGPGGGGGGGVGPPDVGAHEVLRFVRALEAALDRVAAAPVWSMSVPEQREALRSLYRVENRLAGLRLRVLAGADRNQVGAESGATSTAAWLAHETRVTRARAHREVRLATAVEETFEGTGRALAEGRVDAEQAAVVVDAVSRLRNDHDDLPPGTHRVAEAHLLDLAGSFDAAMLRRLGRRVFEVVCPEAADRVEGEQLAREEERARRVAAFVMHDNGDGTVEGRFRLPVLHASVLKKAVETLIAPRRTGRRARADRPGAAEADTGQTGTGQTGTGRAGTDEAGTGGADAAARLSRIDPVTGDRLEARTLRGHGLMELIEHHLAVGTLPSQAGSPFTVVVTMGLDALMSGLGAAGLETGERISAGQARRLACSAGLIPMVLDGDSVPLDLGRAKRLFDKNQHIALRHIFGGCAAVNCDWPPSWTEAHHRTAWRHGGRTDLRDGILLCPPHHHMADHPESWHLEHQPHGGVRFTRRQ